MSTRASFACSFPDCPRAFELESARNMHERTHYLSTRAPRPQAPASSPGQAPVDLRLATGTIAAVLAQLDRFHSVLHELVAVGGNDREAAALAANIERLHDALSITLELAELEVYPQLSTEQLRTMLEMRRAGASSIDPIKTV